MNLPSFTDIWTYVGPLIGAIIGVIGKYLLDRRKERLKRSEAVQVVECIELINAKVLDREALGPIAAKMVIRVPETAPGSGLIDVDEIYFARYRLRNLSDTPVSKLLLHSKNEPKSVTFRVGEGEGQGSPDWNKQLKTLLEEGKVSERRGWDTYPIPYLNPYSSTGHEVFLDLSSYLPLHEVEIAGGAKGVKFVFKKSNT